MTSKWKGSRSAFASGLSYRLGHEIGRYFRPANPDKKRRFIPERYGEPPKDVKTEKGIRSWRSE